MKIFGVISVLFTIAVAAASAWLTGLFLFVTSVNEYSEPAIDEKLPAAEAIVVLTGGSERIETGAKLLDSNKGKKLLISGVPSELSPNSVFSRLNITEEMQKCCVTLGRSADNTIENAEEALAWLKSENFKSFRLVTANYHMPRSLMEFRRAMPEMEIIPHPVAPDVLKLSKWWQKTKTARLLVNEYNKFLFASFRIRLERLL